jgi:hypothetical protein
LSLSDKRAAAAYEAYCSAYGISPNSEALSGWLKEWRSLDEEQRFDQLEATRKESIMPDDDRTQADEQRRKAAESLGEFDRMRAQVAEIKPPYQSGAELDGNYTTQEARDRAAHIPGLHERGPAPETEVQRAARWEWERTEQDRDMKELDAQTGKGEKNDMADRKSKPPVASVSFGDVTGNVWENERKDGKNFYNATFERTYRDTEGNERTSNSFGVSQLGDLRKAADVTEGQMNKLYEEQGKSNTKGGADVTPEEKSRVDQSLGNASIARDKIGPASEVSGKPTPNDPSSMDKSREVGQDLNKSGVTMDKE